MRLPGWLPILLAAAAFAAAVPAVSAQTAPAVELAPPAALTPDALAPASAGGLELVDRALARLASHRRLMVVGAHPDDEDNALLTWVGRGLGGEAAYFSLSRGEGGQNLIGTEMGVELGIVRTGELLAARRVEGTRQYFARAFDFGYTRSLDETLERWPREVLLEDAMRAIRRFKPQVIVAVFPGDARAGHGQHQASGLIAREAFAAAREGRRFPALAGEGLDPWAPAALYQRAWSREQATAGFDLGVLEPLSGRSLAQIAAASRSLHRSQDMGREQRMGRLESGVVWEAGEGANGASLFAGIDTRLEAISDLLPDGARRRAVAGSLRRVSELAIAAQRELTLASLSRAVPPLTEIHRELEEALASLNGASGGERAVFDLLGEKWWIAGQALAAAAGVMIDATADRERIVAGESVDLAVEMWTADPVPAEVGGVLLAGPLAPSPFAAGSADQGVWEQEHSERTGVVTLTTRLEVAADARPTIPYYLRRSRQGDLYDWEDASPAERGEPTQEAPLVALVPMTIAGTDVVLAREFVHRYADQASGEVRRPLRVVPALEVEVEPSLVLWNRARAGESTLRVVLRSNVERPLTGSLRLRGPARGDIAAAADEPRFALDAGRRERVVELPLTLPPSVEPGRESLEVAATLDDGGVATGSVPLVEYPHIRPSPSPRPARVELSVFDLELPPLGRVGYVVGASDRVPAVLSAVGLPLERLAPGDLAREDLGDLDAIVVGSRAYEIDPALAAANGRLLDYARAGGTLIVQYQQYQFVRGGYPPFPLDIARPHGRVTDETAAVEVLEPGHPVFLRPNRLGEADWLGWVQERGLYFADSWDEAYRPLVALADPGREAERGALLVAPLGRGVYVYTGLSFFRQLPAGVPGAIRLFANLLALGGDS